MTQENAGDTSDTNSVVEDLATMAMGVLTFGLGLWMVLSIAAMEDNVFAGMSPGISEKQYPNLLGVALMVGSVVVFLRPFLRCLAVSGLNLAGLRDAQPWGKIGLAILSFFLYLLLFENLGYILSTTLFGAALMWIGGARSWAAIAFAPPALSVVIYWVIRLSFSVHLPRGDVWAAVFGG